MITMKTNNNLYGTSDMGLSIALICDGYILSGIEKPSHGNRFTFCFQPQKGIRESIEAYWGGRLRVDAKAYWNESKNLKTRLYA
jgi:hypothetical protein